MTILVTILTVVVALLALLVVGLLRSHAAILKQLHELGAGVGDPAQPAGVKTPVEFKMQSGLPTLAGDTGFRDAADVSGSGIDDAAVALRVVGARHPTLLAFLSSSCLTCAGFWESFADADQLLLPESTRLVIVTKDASEESPSAIARLAPPGLPLVMSSAAWGDYEVPGSPYFVFVDGPTGRVRGEGTGATWKQVANLLAQATGDLTFTAGPNAARRSKPQSDAEREREIDQQLLAAGILPGDPSLYPGTDPEQI
ncbi:MAG: hypothetical protein ACXWB2_07915 [Acidimicrobiales bacterium]